MSERRDKFLRAGRELVREDQLAGRSRASLALSHVRLADVAERLGVRKSAAYHYWHSQEDFWDDLLDVLLMDGHLIGALRGAPASCAATSTAAPRDIWRLGDSMFEMMSDDDVLMVALAMLAYHVEGTAREELSNATETAVADIERFLSTTLPRVRLEMRPGTTERRLATSLLGLLIGLCVRRRRSGSDALEPGVDEGRHSLFADGAAALIFQATVPLDRRPDASRRGRR